MQQHRLHEEEQESRFENMHIQKLSTERAYTTAVPLRMVKTRNSLQTGVKSLQELIRTENTEGKSSSSSYLKLRDKRSLAAMVREAKAIAAQTAEQDSAERLSSPFFNTRRMFSPERVDTAQRFMRSTQKLRYTAELLES